MVQKYKQKETSKLLKREKKAVIQFMCFKIETFKEKETISTNFK